jgi:hypothetical protein
MLANLILDKKPEIVNFRETHLRYITSEAHAERQAKQYLAEGVHFGEMCPWSGVTKFHCCLMTMSN